MSSKTKPEVATARTRLDATLQHLVDKKEDGDLSVDEDQIQPVLFPSPSKPAYSPRKLAAAKNSRKRKRRSESEDDEGEGKQTVIMKLFERSVDLAQFPEDSPLYPVCRAWLHNRPHDKSLGTLVGRPPSPKMDDEPTSEIYANVYEMPLPIKSEDGCLYDLRVPQAIPQPKERLNIHADPRFAPAPEQLLLNHMARWKDVRNSWREASVMNEMQYASSINLLKEMFERNMGDTI